MGYLDENLLTDEIVLYRIKPHWIIFSPAITWLAISCALIMFGTQVPLLNSPLFTSLPLNVLAALVAALLAILYALGSLVIYITSEFGITTKRVLMKTGLINRVSLEIMLSRIEGIQVYQSLLGRMLNYGSIVISGTGGSKDPFPNIPDPLIFRRKVQEQLDNR